MCKIHSFKCPSNLWLVGEGTAREYVGDVNCSSTEADKWALDDGTMETKLVCIDEGEEMFRISKMLCRLCGRFLLGMAGN